MWDKLLIFFTVSHFSFLTYDALVKGEINEQTHIEQIQHNSRIYYTRPNNKNIKRYKQ